MMKTLNYYKGVIMLIFVLFSTATALSNNVQQINTYENNQIAYYEK